MHVDKSELRRKMDKKSHFCKLDPHQLYSFKQDSSCISSDAKIRILSQADQQSALTAPYCGTPVNPQ